ncbi:MAG: Trm112 family protein [Candidatus Omnitrophica bacterium]|nr:Trm112 family protein [Candidatus Omnitrophota bacterium]
MREELIKILACPVCKTDVSQEGEKIVCSCCGRSFPIRNGIPVMLADEAETNLKETDDGK